MTSEQSFALSWRPARPSDDEAIASMCLSLYAEDPGIAVVDRSRVLRTLETFRTQPHRGQAVVVEVADFVCGYALLVPFWSNEFGGYICDVNEIFVQEAFRGRGLGAALFSAIASGAFFANESFVALSLGVTDPNTRARSLYERLGFQPVGTLMVRMLQREPLEK